VAEREPWEDTLRGLRGSVRTELSPAAPGAVRVPGNPRRRVRRTSTALIAAAATLVVVIGGANLVRGTGSPPMPPADIPSSSASPTPAGPSPRTSRSVAPWPAPLDDPIAEVDWARATVQMPVHHGCPAGRYEFHAGDERVAARDYPRAISDPDRIAYGDLTGDGRPEAVLSVSCFADPEDSGDGQGQLLIVTRRSDRLVGLAWVGPRGGLYPEFWVSDGQLLADVHPWHTGWGYRLGQVKGWRWDGASPVSLDTDARYRPLIGDAAVTLGPQIDLRGVAGAMACPATALRFDREGFAQGAGARWDLEQPASPDDLPHWVDLQGDGRRHLVVAVGCNWAADGPDASTRAVVVLERTGDGYRALDALAAPQGMTQAGWGYNRGVLTLHVAPAAGGNMIDVPYTWNGSYFQR
jgi:hypothetical protein